ncbi:MAG: choice-of-anchor D domain-containing protein, partial [Candidatus Cloacimonadaceae bacterium]|nr:choice-of-anchor D domain-containing protein [Candidatus Cloacimonadaceae bacterium]
RHPIHSNPWGICYDGTNLWIGSSSGRFSAYSTTGALIRSFTNPILTNPSMAFDGTNFIVANPYVTNPSIYRVNTNGAIIGAPLSSSFGGRISQFTWVPWHQNGELWAVDSAQRRLRQFRIQGSQLLQVSSIQASFQESNAITHDGRDLWIGENQAGLLYRIDDGISEFNWVTLSQDTGTIPAGEQHLIDLSFQARTRFAGDYQATMAITSNDPLNSLINIPVNLTIIGTATIYNPIDQIDFANVFIGYPQTRSFRISNTGSSNLDVSLSLSPPYSADQTVFSIAPLAGRDIQITLNPSSVSSYPQIMYINSNDPDNPVVQVSLLGEAFYPPSISVLPSMISTQLSNLDDIEEHAITVSNTGGYPLQFEVFLDEQSGREHDRSTGTYRHLGDVIATYNNFPSNSMGMLWLDNSLYVVDSANGKLKVYNPDTQSISAEYRIHNYPFGIAWDGTAFWIGDQSGYLFRYHPSGLGTASSVTSGSFKSPVNGLASFCWTGEAFLINHAWVESGNTQFYKVGSTGTLFETYNSNVGT